MWSFVFCIFEKELHIFDLCSFCSANLQINRKFV